MTKKPSQFAQLLAPLVIGTLFAPCTMKGGRVTHRVSVAQDNWPHTSSALCGALPTIGIGWTRQGVERTDRPPCARCLSALTDLTRGAKS